MRPSNRLRWRLTLLFSLVALLLGGVLLFLVASLGRDAQGPPIDGAGATLGAKPAFPSARPAAARENDLPLGEATIPVLGLLIMAPLSLGAGWMLAGRVLRPIRTMTASLQRISGPNVHERLALAGPNDELKNLADTIDGLLGRLESALDGHKRFVANAAHELRTPLTVEHALLEESLIDPAATLESYRANFDRLLAVNRHRGELLESLLTLTGSESVRDGGEPVDLGQVVTAALAERSGSLRRGGLRAETVIRPATVVGDRTLLARLVANLLDNAIHYNHPGGLVDATVRVAGGRARLVVSNTGAPVPVEQVDRLFEPFHRLHRVADDGHHGLGLSIVRAVGLAHGATVSARARPAGGLSVEVDFPA